MENVKQYNKDTFRVECDLIFNISHHFDANLHFFLCFLLFCLFYLLICNIRNSYLGSRTIMLLLLLFIKFYIGLLTGKKKNNVLCFL